ncbi:helix-turn-helix domain-containing protein [Geothrix sp. 21YS21S-4]|jgi:DNA-binding protein Fis|uniref:helix-turn-helix domain-containing protein n=1 Tax=Geothrix sp. 21YS21S-4 TaxID=3068889 RepID=UPI0027B9418E|nr:helix-turn-helix domain-containing protein [Geothrix sp. 21YS21S-4]
MREKLRVLVAEMVRGGVPLEMARREFERLYLEEVLTAHSGNHSAAARELGIHRNTLAKKLEAPLSRLRQVSLAS